MASFQDRVIGAMRLNAATFEEVEHDQNATGQAVAVVTAVGLASGLASISGGITVVLVSPVLQLIGWAIGAAVLLVVGTKLFPGKNTEADMGQMLRTLGFAQAAGLFGIFGIIPFLGFLIQFVVSIWILVAMVIAVRQALDYDDTVKAIVVCLVAWLIMLAFTVVAGMFGFGAAMAGGML